MRQSLKRLGALLRTPGRYYFWGSAFILLVAWSVISGQISDRYRFGSGELYQDVVDRWGAPIAQAAPSLRYVESGSVFNTLRPLSLESHVVGLDATMNYRKRGLLYFSGFDFDFQGRYAAQNPEVHPIDLVFVFPLELERRSMVSDLEFFVDGEAAPLPLAEKADKLIWTGRLQAGEGVAFEIRFRGRGLDSFRYALDPDLPVRNFSLDIGIEGGRNYDYAPGVVPANEVDESAEGIRLKWHFASLEAGFPFGVILPSEDSYDTILLTLIRRAWAPFVILFATLVALASAVGRPLRRAETYLIAAAYAFFFVLLPYLTAFMHFYLATAISFCALGGLLVLYLGKLLGAPFRRVIAFLIVALLGVPTLAVILQGYTGLIYALEILAGLALAMSLTTRPHIQRLIDHFEAPLRGEEQSHA